MRNELVKTALMSPVAVFLLAVMTSVLGIYCLVEFTETLFLPLLFSTLMMPIVLSAATELTKQLHDQWESLAHKNGYSMA